MRLSNDAPTPAAHEVVCLAGILSSFAEGATAALPKLTGLRLSESTVERTTEAVGRDVGARLAGGAASGAARDWDWHKDGEGKTCAYVSLDATGVRQQGPDGAQAEGRMVTVAMVYNPVPEAKDRRACPDGPTPRFNVRYVAGLDGIAALGEPLRRQAARVGMDRAARWIAISDGGAGLEDWLRTNFGRVDAVILDFDHASEYLGDLGRALHPEDEGVRAAWLDGWCHRLKHDGGAAVLEDLRGLEVRGRAAREALAAVVRVFREPVAPDGLPRLCGQGLGDRFGAGRIGVQDGDRSTYERSRHALGGRRRRRPQPSAGAVQERRPAVGRLLASGAELT